MDRAGHGGDWRLGNAAPLRQTVVRKAATLLLGSSSVIQTFRSERGCGAASKRVLGAAGDAWASVAGMACLWPGLRPVALATAADNCRDDRIFTRRGDGHAVFCDGDTGDGDCGGTAGIRAKSSRRGP